MKKMYSLLFTLCLGCLLSFSAEAQNQQPFKLKAESATASSGTTVCLDVEVHGGYELLSIQYSMHYDPTVLNFSSLQNFNLPGLSETSFGVPDENSALPEGLITISWLDNNDQLQPTTDGQSLYQVCFEVVGAAGTYSEVTFSEEPTSFEAITANDAFLPISYVGGQVRVDGVNPAMSISSCIVTTFDCQNSLIDLTLTGGTAPYQYAWTNNAGVAFSTEDLSDVASGVYHLTITDAASTTLTALFHTAPSNQSFILNVAITDATCAQNDGAIHLSPINDFSIIFNWDFGATSELVTDLAAGNYTVTLTDTQTGCTQVETFTVENSEIIIGISYECQLPNQSELTVLIWAGGTAPYQITLAGQVMTVADLLTPATFNLPPTTATYIVTVTDANGCSTTSTQTVDCQENTELLVGTSYICVSPDMAELTTILWSGGVAPYRFSIDGGLTFLTTNAVGEAVTFAVSPAATYELIVMDASGLMANATVYIDCEDLPDFDGHLYLSAPQIVVNPGSTFCLPVIVDSFIDINSLQFAMSWDKNVVSFTGVNNFAPLLNLENTNFGLTNEPLEQGILRFSWLDANLTGETLPNGSILFNICFSVIGDNGSSSGFNFTDSPILIEATNTDLEYVQVISSNGRIDVNNEVPQDVVTFLASNEVTYPDAEVCVDISVEHFTDILSMQFSMQWDPAVLRYSSLQVPDDVLAGLGETGLGSAVNDSQLAVAWFASDAINGISFADGTTIFQVCFEVRGEDGESSLIQFTNIPTPIEIFNDSDQPLSFFGQEGLVTIDLDGFVVPGDTDHDLEANHFDLLNIGLGFGQTGPVRADASLEFVPQLAENWGLSTPNSGLDYKHADTDGNGVINADDTLGIIVNWGESLNFLAHDNTPHFDQLGGERQLMAPFFVLPDTINAGEAASFPIILGTPNFPANDVYGIAFTLLYDKEVIVEESVEAHFEQSWLGTLNSDMISIQKDFYTTGQIDIAITRTDGQAMNGAGQLGIINVIIEDVIFRSSAVYEMIFNIINVRAISPLQEPLVFLPTETISIINSEPLSVNNSELEPLITILPNPVQDYFYLQTADINVHQIEVYNINGQLLSSHASTNKMATTELTSGTYLVKMITDSGVVTKKIVVQR